MIDSRFFTSSTPMTCSQVSKLTGALIRQEQSKPVTVTTVADHSGGNLGSAAIFLGNVKLLDRIKDKSPAACFVSPKLLARVVDEGLMKDTCLLEAANPRAAYAILARYLHQSLSETQDININETRGDDLNLINKTAIISDTAVIGQYVRIGPGAFIGPGVVIGDYCHIGPNVTITHATLGTNCRILAGATIGEAGFGFVMHEGKQIRIPQLGIVEIGNDVEVGANTTVDRGTLQNTIIGDETKIDNLVQVAHNVVLGKQCAIASLTGISGSCTIGDGVMMGGQVGMADHVHIGAGAIISARSGLMRDIPAGKAQWGGAPAQPIRQFMRELAAIQRLAKQK